MIVKVRNRIGWLAIFLLALNLTSCGSVYNGILSAPQSRSNDQPGGFPVDPLFIDFYNTLNSIQSLGPALTPLRQEGVVYKQYLFTGLLLYDPRLPESEQFKLAPLGLKFSVKTSPVEDPHLPGIRYVNGHTIRGDFLKLYDALGGAYIVGKPLSEENYNPDRQRIEQYFENLGFYRPSDDPSAPILLMAYGAAACEGECNQEIHDKAAIPYSHPIFSEPFNSYIQRLGESVTGQALTGIVPGEDGRSMVIFENLVVVSDPQSPQGVSLFPIARDVGIMPGELEQPDSNPLNMFIAIEENLGYNVPVLFMDFLFNLGGLEFSGLPVTGVTYLPLGLYQQCFTNLCLSFKIHTEADGVGHRQIALVPLGQTYKEKVYDHLHDFLNSQSLKYVNIRVWEREESINKREMQTISAAIFERGIPLPNREPVLQLTYPNLTVHNITMPPTDTNGKTSIVLPPIKAPNNTMIFYQVCLYGFGNDRSVCVKDHYTIWNEP
jgi:hypothetical protein